MGSFELIGSFLPRLFRANPTNPNRVAPELIKLFKNILGILNRSVRSFKYVNDLSDSLVVDESR